MTNVKEIAELIAIYQSMYPHKQMSAKALLAYADFLKGYPMEQIKAGLKKSIVNKKDYFPSVAEVIENIEGLKTFVATNGKGVPSASEAWEEVMQQANRHGEFTNMWQFTTPEIDRAVKRFGKMDIILCPQDAIGVAKAQFRKMYEEELSRVSERRMAESILSGEMTSIINKLANNQRVMVLEG